MKIDCELAGYRKKPRSFALVGCFLAQFSSRPAARAACPVLSAPLSVLFFLPYLWWLSVFPGSEYRARYLLRTRHRTGLDFYVPYDQITP